MRKREENGNGGFGKAFANVHTFQPIDYFRGKARLCGQEKRRIDKGKGACLCSNDSPGPYPLQAP